MNNIQKEKIGAVLIVGGGIGGMQSALDLADSGIKVYLVDNKSSIGGVMSQLDKTFPTNDCAMCTMAPRLVAIGRHKDIEVITLADVEKIEGEAGNFKVILNKKARYINEEKCTGCGECVEKCPIQILSDYNMGLATDKAIYRRYPQAVPGSFAINKLGQSPCRVACPAGQKAHGYIALIREKRFEEAYKVILRDNPLPSVCGRVCVHYCEKECTRKHVDEAVSIMNLKRFIADWAFENKVKVETEKIEDNGKAVAIVGSGPAGLTAGYFLALRGYKVTIFEAKSVVGGMLRIAIPKYRLPGEILDRDINVIKNAGVRFKTNTILGRDISIDSLFREGYRAIFIAIGAHKSMRLNIPEEDTEGVIPSLIFLEAVNLGKELKIGRRVGIIGGGNSAVDSARVAHRLSGTEKVTIIYRRTRAEMPAFKEEVDAAIEEGIGIEFLTAPVRILTRHGKLTGIECIRMKLGEADETGRARPIPIKGSQFTIGLDTLIAAIGEQPDLSRIGVEYGLEVSKRNTLNVDPETLSTSQNGVFAGGDAVTGPSTVIDAISAGKRAAESIDRYLKGEKVRQPSPKPHKVELSEKEIFSRLMNKERRHLAARTPPEERVKNFSEVQKGFSQEEALKEAERCLNCGICSECLLCVETCQAKAIEHDMQREKFLRLDVGAIILSPGYEIFDARIKEELGYGRYSNVITSIEFERILSASGPFLGSVLRPSDKKAPKRIAFIQCVGSRDYERDYCSAVCCMYATKEAIIAKEHDDELKCDIFFMDIRAYSKGFEEYYQRAKKHGVNYIRCRIPTIEEIPETKNLLIKYLTENDKKVSGEYDMVVLSVGIQPPKTVKEISEKFGIQLNEFNFCKTSTFKPVESTREGIYVAGPFTEPKDIPETVMQASASASKVLSLLNDVKGSLIIPKEYPPEIDVVGQDPRIGIFVCHCGTNIAGVVNVPEVVEYARTLPNVVYAENNLYTCSNDTQERMKDKIKEYNLNRVVVAACTPRTHEPLFRNTMREAGLNPYLFEMANIRDQCSWVHMHEPEKATKKARDLIRMAAAKARLLEPLKKGTLEIKKDALVVGGGLSGMIAAIELANQGFGVYLVEKEKELGGNLKHIHYLLNGEKPQEELKSLIQKIKINNKIHLFTEGKIEVIEGSVGNFKTKITTDGQLKEFEHGVIIVATGAEQYKPREYLYGEDERILTQVELEEQLAVSGDQFAITDNKKPKTVVMIQCVGSRDKEKPYCSRICCAEAVKNALKIKELSPEINVYILYRDIRTYGFRESYYTEARKKGVVFIRYDEDKKPEVLKNGNGLKVKVFDQILNIPIEIPVDLVVLSAGIVPNDENKTIAQFLKVPLTQDGFFLEAHMKLRPVDFATDGIFLCGLAHSSKSIEESIMQAQAAAARASTILSQDRIELEANISHVIDENCDGCAYCVDPCPYKAITLIEYIWQGAIKKTVEVNESICKGCGTCMATCPKMGIFVKGFTLEQIRAQIEAALQQV